jgi:ABC-type Fe3+-siderophore transport system permease subunit
MEMLIPISLFLAIFGIFYLYFTTRNRERLALIEKGVGADLFVSDKKGKSSSAWRVLTLNTALLAIGIGLGVFLASLITATTAMDEDATYPAMIFLMGGLGLLSAYFINKREDRKEEEY